ncbi:hypothetical protein [Streptosporangium sp. NPDC000396]
MGALLRRLGQVQDISFDEDRGEVCDTACHARAAVDRALINTLLFR